MSSEQLVVLFAFSSVCLCTLVASQPSPYELVVNREEPNAQGASVDLITLQCQNSSTKSVLPIQSVKFRRNGQQEAGGPDFQVKRNFSGMYIKFQLIVEGNYSCGVRAQDGVNIVESQPVPIVALQTFFDDIEDRTTRRYFVASGGTVQLRCPVQPRGLPNYYFGQWRRNRTTLIEISPPSRDGAQGDIIGSSSVVDIDRDTFTLTLRSVNISAASNNYHCRLFNIDPTVTNNNQHQEFTQAFELNIALMVNEKPSVLEGPKPFIVGLQDVNTEQPSFTCKVGGAPPPTLFWTYIPGLSDDNTPQLLQDGDKYNIVLTNATQGDDGLYVVNSTIRFLSATNTDGGIVRCNAGSGASYADALLTILGTADRIDVFVSRDEDVIYELDFPVKVQHPVSLNITYSSGGATDSRIADVTYNNTRIISYKEVSSERPFSVYYVSIALVAEDGSQRITGEPTARPDKIDTNKLDPIVLAGIIGALAVVVTGIVVLIVAIVVAVPCYRHKQTVMIKDVFNDPDKYMQNWTQQEKDEKMRKLQKKFWHRIGVDGGGDVYAVTNFLLLSAMEGLKSNSQHKKEFIEAVKNSLQLPSVNSVTLQPADPSEHRQDNGEATNNREFGYHESRGVGKDGVVGMSPPGSPTTSTKADESSM